MHKTVPSTCDFHMDDCDPQEVVNAMITLMQAPGATDTTEIRVTPRAVGDLSDPRWDIDVQSVPLYVAVRLDETRTELRERKQTKVLEERRARGAWTPPPQAAEDTDAEEPPRCACGHLGGQHDKLLGCTAEARSAFQGLVTCPCRDYREATRG